MGNTISTDTDYRVSGKELMELSYILQDIGSSLSYYEDRPMEALLGITTEPESVIKAIAALGVMAVRSKEILLDYRRRLSHIAYNMAHTPIEKEDNNGK